MFEPSHHEPAAGAVAPSLETGPRAGEYLPLQAQVERTERGVRIRLPLRAEDVWVEKEAFVYEEVVVQERRVEETVRAVDQVRHEELRTDGREDLAPTQRIPLTAQQQQELRRQAQRRRRAGS